MSLFRLPFEVTQSLLFDWLVEWSDVVKLDAAFCNQLERQQFLKLISSLTFPSSPYCTKIKYKEREVTLRWLVSRRVKFKSLSSYVLWPPDHNNNTWALMDSLFRNTGEKLTKIKIKDEMGSFRGHTLGRAYTNFCFHFWSDVSFHCPNLTHFTALNTTCFLGVLVACPKLIAVNVCDCDLFELRAMRGLLRRAPDLKELKVCRTNVCDKALMELATERPLLTKLHCRNCRWVTIIGVLAFVQRCSNLQELCTDKIDGHVLAKIAECCPHFRSLRSDTKVSDASLLDLLEHCKMEVLDITDSFITAQTFCKLRNMTKISLGGVSDINDAALKTLAEQNPQLLELSLRKGYSNITKNGVEHLVARCSLIENIFLVTTVPGGCTLFHIARKNGNVKLTVTEVINE